MITNVLPPFLWFTVYVIYNTTDLLYTWQCDSAGTETATCLPKVHHNVQISTLSVEKFSGSVASTSPRLFFQATIE